MVKKVDLHFGGYKTGNEASIPTLWQAHNTTSKENQHKSDIMKNKNTYK